MRKTNERGERKTNERGERKIMSEKRENKLMCKY